MADLKTKYLGIEVKNPVIAGASRLTANVDKIKEIEAAGAAAVVCASLFEEQIQLQLYKQDKDLEKMSLSSSDPEMGRLFEDHASGGPNEHLMWVKRTKEAVAIPVIGSLNAVNDETWIEYAKKMQDTGVDALECNFYYVPDDSGKSPDEIESKQLKTMEKIKKAVSIPVSAKLSYFYSNPLGFITKAAATGVDGFILFNRLFEPDISLDKQKHLTPLNLSNSGDNRIALRYAGLLYNNIKADIISNTGFFDGRDVAKALLAGADSVQVVSTLFKNGIKQIGVILSELEEFMNANSYASISDFKGKLARKNINDPFVYKRAQYINLLLKSELLRA
jgi:dihydroorotate dehydrogenase (fumarate)